MDLFSELIFDYFHNLIKEIISPHSLLELPTLHVPELDGSTVRFERGETLENCASSVILSKFWTSCPPGLVFSWGMGSPEPEPSEPMIQDQKGVVSLSRSVKNLSKLICYFCSSSRLKGIGCAPSFSYQSDQQGRDSLEMTWYNSVQPKIHL